MDRSFKIVLLSSATTLLLVYSLSFCVLAENPCELSEKDCGRNLGDGNAKSDNDKLGEERKESSSQVEGSYHTTEFQKGASKHSSRGKKISDKCFRGLLGCFSGPTSPTNMKIENSPDSDKKQLENYNVVLDKCHENKYDRIIAEKLKAKELSLTIVKSDGRFDNPFPTWRRPTFVDLLKSGILEPKKSNVPTDKLELERELPLHKPDFRAADDKSSTYKVTWIGHSTLLIQVDGFNILTDPIFSDRASLTQYVGPKRIREPACDIHSLPSIDIVLISHNHFDHLDTNSVRELNDRFGLECRWIVPKGLGEWMESMTVRNYVELDWWQKDCYHPSHHQYVEDTSETVSKTLQVSMLTKSGIAPRKDDGKFTVYNQDEGEFSIYLTPTQHWTRRGIYDYNKSLWGSYTIVNRKGNTFLFTGDSGYCIAFKEIGSVFGPFAGAAIPIGAYDPRWMLKVSHVDPEEAVKIHREIRSDKSIAIHHSTFILSNEDFREPKRLLNEIMGNLSREEKVKEPFFAPDHGQSVEF